MSRSDEPIFAKERDAILAKCEKLKAELQPEEVRRLEAQALKPLRESRFDIAVVGQMKAGKSTLLNGLIERPGLLPTSVNPYTAVIAHLHFGKPDGPKGLGQPGGPQMVGRFEFYSKDAWRELTDREQSPTSRPAKGSIFGFGSRRETIPEELKRQGRELRDEAQRRLGRDELERLLGSPPKEVPVEPGVLEEYLCVGDLDGATKAGRYACITREAELFLPLTPFTEYTTLVDTPGTNDPFRLREQKTFDYVATAQAFFLVMNSQAALAQEDVHLLRELVYLVHSNVVVFVNWIDKLNDIAADLPKVRKRVAQDLEKFFPGESVRVLYGSAIWAERSGGDLELVKKVVKNENFQWQVKEMALATQGDVDSWLKEPEKHEQTIRDAVFRASGVYDLRKVLQHTLMSQKGDRLLRRSLRTLSALARDCAEARSAEAQAAEGEAKSAHATEQEVRDTLKKCQDKLAAMEKRMDSLDESLKTRSKNLAGARKDALDATKAKLDSIAETFLKREIESFSGTFTLFISKWTTDFDELRRTIRNEFLGLYERESGKLNKALGDAITDSSREANDVDPLLASTLRRVLVSEVDVDAPLRPLAGTTEMELPPFWERLLREAMGDFTDVKSRLDERIRQRVEEAVKGLLDNTSRAFDEAISGTLLNLEETVKQVGGKIQKQRQDEQGRLQEILNNRNPEALAKMAREREGVAGTLTVQAATLKGMALEFEEMMPSESE